MTRATAPDLLRHALAALPAAAPDLRARGDARRRRYFAGQLARTAHDTRIAFAIGAKRIAPLWRLLAVIPEDGIGSDQALVTAEGAPHTHWAVPGPEPNWDRAVHRHEPRYPGDGHHPNSGVQTPVTGTGIWH